MSGGNCGSRTTSPKNHEGKPFFSFSFLCMGKGKVLSLTSMLVFVVEGEVV